MGAPLAPLLRSVGIASLPLADGQRTVYREVWQAAVGMLHKTTSPIVKMPTARKNLAGQRYSPLGETRGVTRLCSVRQVKNSLDDRFAVFGSTRIANDVGQRMKLG